VDKEISGWDYEKISKQVYGALYEDLVAFGVKEDISALYLTMPLVEHLSINLLGFWHFKLEQKPRESRDGLFHGLLSLNGCPHSSSDLWKFEGSNAPLPSQTCDKIIAF
jgi:hypothetical protein